jgi:uncharacterized protein (UPF0147 family)
MDEMTKEATLELIEKEFSQAAQAEVEGNDGMVRVCARRAAGVAIRFWLQQHPRKFWGIDAMNQLRNVHLDQSVPQGVRSAARRLTARIPAEFESPQKSDPVEDSRVIITHFLETT